MDRFTEPKMPDRPTAADAPGFSMTLREMLAEYLKGCSVTQCRNRPVGPEHCPECVAAFVNALIRNVGRIEPLSVDGIIPEGDGS